MSQHNIKAPRIDFWNLGGQIGYSCLFLTDFWSCKPTETSKQIKTHTGTSVYIIHDIKKSWEMCQHKIKSTELNFQDFWGQNLLFLLIFDQFKQIETHTHHFPSYDHWESFGMPQYASKSVYVFKMSWKWPISALRSPSFSFLGVQTAKNEFFQKIFFETSQQTKMTSKKRQASIFWR